MALGQAHELVVRTLPAAATISVAGAILLLAPVVQIGGRYPADAHFIAEDRAPERLVAEDAAHSSSKIRSDGRVGDLGELLQHHFFLALEVVGGEVWPQDEVGDQLDRERHMLGHRPRPCRRSRRARCRR